MTISIIFGDISKKEVTFFQLPRSQTENTYLCGMKRYLLSLVFLLLLCSCQQQPETLFVGDVPFIPMETEKLSDMTVPRAGHALVWAYDHVLAIGGHTTGFVPTPTAEYYKNGKWHQIPTLYSHDTPFALVLNDGDVLVGGGYEKSLGVGQTWGVERYRPATHTFSPAYAMNKKRAHANALELENGEILISGNWYDTDLIEIDNDTVEALRLDTASDNRSYPFILPIGNDNAWIIGSTLGSYGGVTRNIVDPIKGEPFQVELLSEWRPKNIVDRNVQAKQLRIAENTFLIPAENAEGQCVPMLVDTGGFSLLPMEQPLPKEGPWGPICYTGSIWTVAETQMAWWMGIDRQNHVFLAEINCQPYFQGAKATFSMHYSPALHQLPSLPWDLMLPDGRFIIAGGLNGTNYDSSASVFAFYPNAQPHHHATLPFLCLGTVMLIGLWVCFALRKKKKDKMAPPSITPEETPSNGKTELGDKLKVLMDEKQLFRNKDLRIADIATSLGTNTTYLSTFLNGEMNTTFPAFITGYRIRYAQDLMRKDPSLRMSQVAEASGFTNEKTFLRTFKTVCGITPSEWKQANTP